MNATDLHSRGPASLAMTASTVSLLRMAVGSEILAVSITEVREILQVGRMTPMPRTPDFVRGVMNLRGAVVPVIDLGARLGGPPASIGRRSCIVVVEVTQADPDTPSMVAGLLVDAVFEVLDRPGNAIEAAPELGNRIDPRYIAGITRAEGRLLNVLALPTLLGVEELVSAIEAHATH